jgi:hypothetical protein
MNEANGDKNNSSNVNFDHNFPDPPIPYDLYGYVRCLNTAGKLALLATTILVPDDEDDAMNYTISSKSQERRQQQPLLYKKKVLIVDLVLEKIAVTTSRRPKKTMDQRLKNLSKKN